MPGFASRKLDRYGEDLPAANLAVMSGTHGGTERGR